jgi:hypothetical protein
MTVLKKFLRRYTDIPGLVYLLNKRCITLVDPQTWDDTNDSYFLRVYQQKRDLASVLALCFTQVAEPYHHWRIFAPGPSGVCISFHRKELLKAVMAFEGVRAAPVKYLRIKEIEEKCIAVEDLTFLKRYPFEPENEFRLLYEDSTKARQTLDMRYRYCASTVLPLARGCKGRALLAS